MKSKKILVIEICDYNSYPIGGYLSFAKQLLTAFGDQLVLVGLSTDDTPVGVWVKKEINNVTYDFFAVRKSNISNKKSIIPGRLKSYFAVRKYRKEIFKHGIENVFVQTPEVLFAIHQINSINLCTRIPGVENPLSISRYWYGKYFAKFFDILFFHALRKSNTILASADKFAIIDFLKRGNNVLHSERVIQFPTRVDTKIFQPVKKELARDILGINSSKLVIVTTGRLSALKGWKFMLESYIEFLLDYPDSIFIFLGDGEDRPKIQEFIKNKNIQHNVQLAGRLSHEKLALYLNASDVYVMGSFIEGWATSLVEAVACAIPVVCTNFSSAKELVEDGYNGFVIETHVKKIFSNAIKECLKIPQQNLIEKSDEMQKYASSSLENSILEHWELK
jgi:glycosyltransferase involved in cell wall biosynthesis